MRLNITKTSGVKSFFLLFVSTIVCGALNAQINVLWESRFTSAGLNNDAGKEIAIDANGNVYVVGTSYTSVANGFDIVTIKYDPLGSQLWTATFNGTGSSLDEGRDIAVDKNGNVYVTGYTASSGPNYDYITIKYNAAGAQQWATPYNGTGNGYDEAYAIAIDTLGNTYVTGSSNAGGQGANFVTIKYNAAGAQQWATPYNGPGNSIDAATQIKLDASFNVYVTGSSDGGASDLDIATIKYNNAGAQQWVSRFNGALSFFDVPEALHIDNLNNVYVAGASYGGLATENDFVTIKINSAGAQQWAQIVDGPQNDEDKAYDVLTDQNQNVYVTGRSMGIASSGENMLTIKYDPLGNQLWQDTYNGPASGYDDAQQMRLGSSGALYITGYSEGLGTNNDYLSLKYDTSNGGIIWEARFNGPANNSDQAFAMEIDAMENLYVTGGSNDPVSGKDYSTIKWCQFTNDAGMDVDVCLGDSVQLNLNAPGAVSYLWTPSTWLTDNTGQNPKAFPPVTTTYTVSATNALGCVDFDTITVHVKALPSNNITASGPTTFCMGDSVTLTVDSASTYLWSPTGDTTQSITVYNSGNYIVNVVDSNNCINSGQQTVTVNNLPNVDAGFDVNLCDGDSIILNASGALTYTWNTQSTLSDSTIANPFAFPSSTTSYWVKGVDGNGCENTDTILVAVSISPIAVMTNSSSNDTLDLNIPNGGDIQFFSNLSTNAISFFWDFGDGGTDNVANPIYTYTGGGVFTVMLIATNGGCTDTAYVTITVINAISVNEHTLENSVSLFPNPAKDYININIDALENKNFSIKLYNSIGKLVETIDNNIGASQILLNTRPLPNGIYFVQFELNDNTFIKRFTVSK